MSDKPDCYKCVHSGGVLGSVHLCCQHPDAGGKDPGAGAMAILASVGRVAPTVDLAGADALGIKADAHGIRMGWFNWPFQFDPVWLRECKGFTAKREG